MREVRPVRYPDRVRTRPATAFVILGILAMTALAGCTSEAPAENGGSTTSPTTAPVETVPPPPSVAECEDVPLKAEESIDGQMLGDCVAAAMVAAGTGVQRVDSSDGTSSIVQFGWTPDYAMSVDAGEQQVVIKGDTGWVMMPGTGWIQSDPASEDPQVVMATGLVELTRVFSDPRVLAAGFATSPTWTVVGEEPLPVDDADATTAWLVTPDSAMTILGVSLSDVQLWLRPDHLGAHFVGTGTVAGISTTTSNTFLEWGGELDLPNPQG